MRILPLFIVALLITVSGYSLTNTSLFPQVFAADSHDDHGHDEKDHAHDDGDHHGDSHDHSAHGDDHKEEGDHEHISDGSDDKHDHGEHEEGRTEIDPKAAHASGIRISTVNAATIKEVITLTGRIILNRNTTAEVRARFPGIVKKVDVSWGDPVKKGQVLAVIEANESLRTYNVTAPSDGILLNRNTNVGNVTGEAPIFTVADLSEVWAEFHVFPRDLPKVKHNQQVGVHTLENEQVQSAPIHLILPTADALSQTVVAIVAMDNHNNQWRPGMMVQGDVMVSETKVGMAVQEQAIQRMENQTVVFVKEDDAYEMRPVSLGMSDGDLVEVKEGLEIGDQYVSQGSFIVKADIGKAEAAHEH